MASPKKSEAKVIPLAGDPEVNAAAAAAQGLSESELSRASKELGRPPTYAELSVLGALWSERESQKSARVHTRRLPSTGSHVVRGLDDSAGAVDLGDGYCAVFTLESRDTGDAAMAATFTLGGAVRDVLATGSRPVAALDAMRFGAPDSPETHEALRATVTRLGAYSKDAGVPMIGGDLQFDARYTRPVIKTLAVGVARTEALLESRSTGFGNAILCVGAKTGAENENKQEPSDPLMQRRLTDACLEAYRLGSIDGARAVGAAGIAGAAARLATGETGVEVDLDLFPRKAKGLTPAEALISTSTERMLLVVKKGREDAVLEVFRRHELDATVVGRVTNTGRMVVKVTPDHDPFSAKKAPEGKQVLVTDLPIALLLTDAPSYERSGKEAPIDRAAPTVTLKRREDLESELVRLLGSVNVGSREWVTKRLEAGAKAAQAKGPASDAAVVGVSVGEGQPLEKLLALSVDGNGRYAALDPREGAAMAVAECARNVVCTGAEPLGLAHSLAFGDVDKPETMWRMSETIDGIRDACVALKLPVVSGEIGVCPSDAPVTPFVAVVGLLRDEKDRVGMGFARQADMVALLGKPGSGNLAGSELVVSRGGPLSGPALHVDLAAEVKLQRAVLELARDRLLSSAHDVSDGGLGVALAECCIAGRIGCSVELPPLNGASELGALFHEEPSRVVVSFPPEQRAKVQERCDSLGVPFKLLGFVGGDTLEIEDVMDVPLQVLAESHTRALARVTGD